MSLTARPVSELSRSALEEIADHAQAGLWLDGGKWTHDKDVSGADYVEHMIRVLARHGLAPTGEEEEEDDTD